MMCAYDKHYYPSDAKTAELDEATATNNIMLISYSVLSQNKEYHSSSPTTCRACGAALCVYSTLYLREDYYKKMEEEENSTQIKDEQKAEQERKDQETDFLKGKYLKDLSADELGWICEFCGVHNRLSKGVDRPQTNDELYLLTKAQENGPIHEETKTETAENIDNEDQTALIFCMDVSGSMNDKHQLLTENDQQVYVSRIKLVRDAVLKQIQQMKVSFPNRKVGLVTFDTKITLYGDCSHSKISVQASINNYEGLLEFSKLKKEAIMTQPLKQSFDTLSQAIKSLVPGSCTALGPGLLCSLGLIQGNPGSRVILCTDGLANEGLGSLEGSNASNESRSFYQKIGDLAVDNGLSISIITIKGNACRVDALGPLTDRTGGTILRVDPSNIDLSEMVANSLIAIDVRLKAFLHEGLAFEHEDSEHLYNNRSILKKKFGSVSENNEAYFEYRVKSVEELLEAGVNLEEAKSIPLQCQITYKDLKGNEFVRVISKQQELTKDQNEAEKNARADILTNYTQKESANLVLQGKVDEAKEKKAALSRQINKIAENPEIDDENKNTFKLFATDNKELDKLIEEAEAADNHPTSTVKKDEITSKLYEIKQNKKK